MENEHRHPGQPPERTPEVAEHFLQIHQDPGRHAQILAQAQELVGPRAGLRSVAGQHEKHLVHGPRQQIGLELIEGNRRAEDAVRGEGVTAVALQQVPDPLESVASAHEDGQPHLPEGNQPPDGQVADQELLRQNEEESHRPAIRHQQAAVVLRLRHEKDGADQHAGDHEGLPGPQSNRFRALGGLHDQQAVVIEQKENDGDEDQQQPKVPADVRHRHTETQRVREVEGQVERTRDEERVQKPKRDLHETGLLLQHLLLRPPL